MSKKAAKTKEEKRIYKDYKIDKMKEEDFVNFMRVSLFRFITPLTSISGYLDLLIEEEYYGKLPPKAKTTLKKISKSVKNFNRFRNELRIVVELYYGDNFETVVSASEESKKPKIVIFEDDPFLAEIYYAEFSKAGFWTKAFRNYKDVVERVAVTKPDILYCGIIVPDKTGFEAIKLLKKDKRTRNIPMIAVDNLGEKEDKEKILKAGADDYFILAKHKPRELVKIFKNYLNQI